MARFEGTDACVAPVLTGTEAAADPANQARGAFVSIGGVVHPAPAPRFGRTPARAPSPPPEAVTDGAVVLADWEGAGGTPAPGAA